MSGVSDTRLLLEDGFAYDTSVDDGKIPHMVDLTSDHVDTLFTEFNLAGDDPALPPLPLSPPPSGISTGATADTQPVDPKVLAVVLAACKQLNLAGVPTAASLKGQLGAAAVKEGQGKHPQVTVNA
mmetsp:Transcript_6533/g.12567  ORF Transcript_6533/g.12567 Transcript_6533/m.12567 type:complete len:126 (+) Transcript_6533:960-1337(+)